MKNWHVLMVLVFVFVAVVAGASLFSRHGLAPQMVAQADAVPRRPSMPVTQPISHSSEAFDWSAAALRENTLPTPSGLTVVGNVIDANTQRAITEFEIAPTTDFDWVEESHLRNAGSEEIFPRPHFRSHPSTWQPSATGDGTFSIALPTTPDRLLVAVRADEYVVAMRDVTTLLQPGSPRLEIRLERGATISGKVTDPWGQALPECSVSVGLDFFAPHYRRYTTTQPDGRFELAGFDPGPWSITTCEAGYLPANSVVQVPIGAQSVNHDVELALSANVEGIISVGGEPLTNTEIGYGRGCRRLSTDETGCYESRGYVPGWTEIEIELGTVRITKTVILESDRINRVDFDLPDCDSMLHGQIQLPPGRNFEQAWLEFRYRSVNGDLFDARFKANADGSYFVEGIPSGSALLAYQVSAESYLYIWGLDAVEIPPQTIVRHDIVVQAGGTVRAHALLTEEQDADRNTSVVLLEGRYSLTEIQERFSMLKDFCVSTMPVGTSKVINSSNPNEVEGGPVDLGEIPPGDYSLVLKAWKPGPSHIRRENPLDDTLFSCVPVTVRPGEDVFVQIAVDDAV